MKRTSFLLLSILLPTIVACRQPQPVNTDTDPANVTVDSTDAAVTTDNDSTGATQSLDMPVETPAIQISDSTKPAAF